MKEEIFELKKADGTTRIIPGILNHNNFLLMNNRPAWNAAMLDKTWSRDAASKITNISDVPVEHHDCLIRFGNNPDGSVLSYRADERKKKNAFLREHGYTWRKESMYIDGYMAAVDPTLSDFDGDFKDIWVLRGKDGNKVEDLEALLIELGYYGEERKKSFAREEAEKADKARIAKETRERCEAAQKEIDAYFDATEYEIPEKVDLSEQSTEYFSFPKKGFNIYGSGTAYMIQPIAIWKLCNNGGDGDNWSRNNFPTGGAGAIAVKFPYSERIEKVIKKNCDEGLYN